MIKWLFDRIEYCGYTKEEAEALAGGGGKSGGQQVMTPPPITTRTALGGQDSLNQAQTFDNTKDPISKAVDKKKLGTRGLVIPLAKDNSTAPVIHTAANTGVQV